MCTVDIIKWQVDQCFFFSEIHLEWITDYCKGHIRVHFHQVCQNNICKQYNLVDILTEIFLFENKLQHKTYPTHIRSECVICHHSWWHYMGLSVVWKLGPHFYGGIPHLSEMQNAS